MKNYVTRRELPSSLRLPLRCSIDLTYRCNNNCRHCWLWLPPNATVQALELSFDEIRSIADEARLLGTREWDISGGEAMLRPDFPEIFDYLTSNSRFYTLRTNGTLITPEIARLMRRPGANWISLYGANAEVYERVTRNPDGFDQLMRSFELLKENGVKFTVQLFPMRENWHQWQQMIDLARSLSSDWRIGAVWLHLSASGDISRNREIMNQRLDPADIIALDPPPIEDDEKLKSLCDRASADNRLFASCISAGNHMHVDPYGQMSFCQIIKNPLLRYDLRQGKLREGWEVFLPSLKDAVHGTENYSKNCAQCDLRADCRWCASYAWLEHGDYSARVEFLCKIAAEARKIKENWRVHHRRFYRTAGITIQVDSDIAMISKTFSPAINTFAVNGPGEDTVRICHHFSFDGLNMEDLGEEVYHNMPWSVFRKGKSWVFRCCSIGIVHCIGVFSSDFKTGRVYHSSPEFWHRENLNVVSLPVTDQILLTRLLIERQGCIFHSAGAILNGKGLLFVGESDAGKTTTTRLLQDYAEILCDDRNIVRRLNNEFHLFGTWSHGDSSLVSSASAPLGAIIFLSKSTDNRLRRLTDRRTIIHRLLPRIVRGLVDGAWWEKTLDVVENLTRAVPCYEMEFDTSGAIVPLLQRL